MKIKVLFVTIVFFVIITLVSVLFVCKINDNTNDDVFRRQLVELNEINRISEDIDDKDNAKSVSELNEAVNQYEDILQDCIQKDENSDTKRFILIEYIICVAFLILVFSYIYFIILKPFDKMKSFADEIAKGNFDVPLRYERSNYFGAFTWAFDSMRKEVIKARSSEKEAILENKTVIASISHDIKTPIASIRAFSEGLSANLYTDAQKKEDYISVILRKCDEVTSLVNDLFLHSISNLDKLKIAMKSENIKHLLVETLEDSDIELCSIHLTGDIPDCTVMLDNRRFEQVIENIISNSLKYAGTDIDVSCNIIDDDYVITIRDYGSGIPDEDMAFIFNKFYRGRNVEDKQGSGLGLYITKYIMDKHNGSIKLFNHEDGLEVVLSFKICSE